jgi:hypothetical protein
MDSDLTTRMAKRMSIRRTVLVLCFLILTAFPLSAGPRDIWIGTFSDSSGTNFEWSVPRSKMESTPAWHGDFSKLPLGFSKAVELSKQNLRTHYPDADTFDVWNISLIRVFLPDLKDRWYFAISFTGTTGGKPLTHLNLSTRVLLDGTVVEPAITKK